MGNEWRGEMSRERAMESPPSPPLSVIPEKAGIQPPQELHERRLDSRFRGNDEVVRVRPGAMSACECGWSDRRIFPRSPSSRTLCFGPVEERCRRLCSVLQIAPRFSRPALSPSLSGLEGEPLMTPNRLMPFVLIAASLILLGVVLTMLVKA